MTPEIKKILLDKAKIYRKYVKQNRDITYGKLLKDITLRCNNMIKIRKEEYFSTLGKKLNDPNIAPKKYWSILNKFLNKRKIPKIPPLCNGNSFITDASNKATMFNDFFAEQCTVLNTPSELPVFEYIKLGSHLWVKWVNF